MRPTGPNLTKIYRYIPKWLPVVLSGDKTGTLEMSLDETDPKKVWSHNKKMSDDRLCRIEATGAIEPSTILTLIAFVASIQNGDGNTKFEDTTVTLTDDNAKKWMEKYLGHRNFKEFSTDIKRLISYKIFWIDPKGGFTTQAYCYDGELKNNKLKIILKRAFVDLCIEKGLEIEFLAMQQRLVKQPVAKLLYMYLCSNSATSYNEMTLIERVGLTNGIRDNRRTLKKAFNALLSASFIQSYEYDDKDRKFSFVSAGQTEHVSQSGTP